MIEHVETIPMIRSFDEAKALEFYQKFLGFKVDFTHSFESDLPLFMQMSLSGMRLYITEHHGDATPGAHVGFKVKGLKKYHRQLKLKNYGFGRPGIGKHIGGGVHVCITDPFGNKIEFVEDKLGFKVWS